MNLEVLNLLLTAALIVYVAIFSIRCKHRLKEIAASVEMCVEKTARVASNIIRFRRPGGPRTGVVMRNEEYHQCALHDRDEA